MIKEGLNIKTLRGDKLIVKRTEFPKKTESGIIMPDNYIKSKEDVSQVIDLPKFQNKGEVIAIGDGVEKDAFALGDIVHFQPNYYQLAIFNKGDMAFITSKESYVSNAEVIIDATNGVDWIEA
jgi:co-chaperonin GroES (HSP10)